MTAVSVLIGKPASATYVIYILACKCVLMCVVQL